MKNKHTYGPWHVSGFNSTSVFTESGKKLCTCTGGSGLDSIAKDQEHAKLIAAAPDVEALQYCVSVLEALGTNTEKWLIYAKETIKNDT